MKSKRAFTLIEILIAVLIFSFTLIIASGVFSGIIGSQSYVSVNAEVNRESQRILRQISDDTVNASAVGTINTNGAIKAKGILFLDNQNALATPSVNCLIPGTPSCNFAGVVLFSDNGLKIYRINPANKSLEYGINSTDPKSNQLQFTSGVPQKLDLTKYTFSKLNNDSVEIISAGFSGISCYNSSCSQAPFVKIDLTTQTKDYESKAARHHAKIELRTMITGRSY